MKSTAVAAVPPCYWCGPRLDEPCRHQRSGRTPNLTSVGGRVILKLSDEAVDLPLDGGGGVPLGRLEAPLGTLHDGCFVVFDPATLMIRRFRP